MVKHRRPDDPSRLGNPELAVLGKCASCTAKPSNLVSPRPRERGGFISGEESRNDYPPKEYEGTPFTPSPLITNKRPACASFSVLCSPVVT